MNAGNVHNIGCARRNSADDTAVCSRQRHHPGDHLGRSEESGRLLEWPDPPYAGHPSVFLDESAGAVDLDALRGPTIGERAELAAELRAGHTWTPPLRFPLTVLAGIAALVAVLCWPAVVVWIYRVGF